MVSVILDHKKEERKEKHINSQPTQLQTAMKMTKWKLLHESLWDSELHHLLSCHHRPDRKSVYIPMEDFSQVESHKGHWEDQGPAFISNWTAQYLLRYILRVLIRQNNMSRSSTISERDGIMSYSNLLCETEGFWVFAMDSSRKANVLDLQSLEYLPQYKRPCGLLTLMANTRPKREHIF